MSATNAKRLAWGLALLSLALMVAATVVAMIDGNRVDPARVSFIWAIIIVFTVAGHVIATRQRGNAIGWLFLGVGLSAALGGLASGYATYWVETGGGSKSLGQTAAAYGELSWMPFILVPATFLLLLFPDGHLLSHRWRPLAWCAAGGIASNFVAEGTRPGPIPDYPGLRNPFGVESEVLYWFELFAVLTLVVAIVGSAVSVVLRFRRARGEQRQQMKWIAIVRHRLYDIDVVINRTLVYGSLTATLAGVYVGSVLLLQLTLSGLTQGSGLAVAASTLAVAALFRPARRRIQRSVDRRFFRSRYDAARTIEAFGARLRDEVDLITLRADLQAVATETMHPAHVSLWLRDVEVRHS